MVVLVAEPIVPGKQLPAAWVVPAEQRAQVCARVSAPPDLPPAPQPPQQPAHTPRPHRQRVPQDAESQNTQYAHYGDRCLISFYVNMFLDHLCNLDIKLLQDAQPQNTQYAHY